ncbi:YhcN/YlaJ family sporulation lipoprotein [Bacillus horti]|uniref:Sporulation protein n=1 Tax=Caldalkalibacillus horti TaxID=77523 RepID=A0ABT9VUW1_9BACI|nr:YhcN/YlaJ family sporulation lipoprotein [Bacillus horti]MDQ0164415.1 hypothetical protein [Bacillus horti]
MNKRWIALALLPMLFLTSACQANLGQEASPYQYPNNSKGLKALYKKQGAEQADENDAVRSIFPQAHDMNTRLENNHKLGRTPEPGGDMSQDSIPYGYVEHKKNDPEVLQQGYGMDINIDREVLADGISQIVVGLPNVQESAVITTKREIIIGYTASSVSDPELVREQVQLAGEALAPRWFDIYVADDIELVRSLEDVTKVPSHHRVEAQLRAQVDHIIKKLGGPRDPYQSKRINEQLDKDMKHNMDQKHE